jgi:hypothetical protein
VLQKVFVAFLHRWESDVAVEVGADVRIGGRVLCRVFNEAPGVAE